MFAGRHATAATTTTATTTTTTTTVTTTTTTTATCEKRNCFYFASVSGGTKGPMFVRKQAFCYFL